MAVSVFGIGTDVMTVAATVVVTKLVSATVVVATVVAATGVSVSISDWDRHHDC